MERDDFRARLVEATDRVFEYEAHFGRERPGGKILYRPILRSEDHRTPIPGREFKYPWDADPETATVDSLPVYETDPLVDLLWHDGQVPEWIDLWEANEDDSGDVTFLLVCCGIYTADDELLYSHYEAPGVETLIFNGPNLTRLLAPRAAPPSIPLWARSRLCTAFVVRVRRYRHAFRRVARPGS
jgi:hypothetical protein